MKYLEPFVSVALSLFLAGILSCQGSLELGDGTVDGADGDASADAHGDTGADAQIEIPPGCGDGVVGAGEECDSAAGATHPCTTACGSAGTQHCTSVCTWGACEPPDEICNGADDDCDGDADDGFECEAGSSEVCFEYCGVDIRRTCSPSCTWGECALPPEGCNEFIVPYMENPYPDGVTLVFSAGIVKADVYFLVDTTGSMRQVVTALQDSIASAIFPVMAGAVSDIHFGVGYFEDYPVNPYGTAGDVSFESLSRLDPDTTAAYGAVMALATGTGGDYPESHVVALTTIATGDPGLTQPLQPAPACGADLFGYPCFRQEAFPLIVLLSDADFHNGPGGTNPYTTVTAPTYDEAVGALVAAHIRVMSVHSGTMSTDADYRQLATDTGAVGFGGSPFVGNIPANGAGLDAAVTNSFQALATSVPMSVTARSVDDPSDGVDATAFIARIVPDTVGGVEDPLHPGVFCDAGLPADDVDGDGFDDTFTSIPAGTVVCFDVVPLRNTTVSTPGVYNAFIEIVGDGTIFLDRREVGFIVP
jgi:hypothetical protein